MTNDAMLINELRDALADVIANLAEDVPEDAWSRHLISAVNYAAELLAHTNPQG